MRQRHIEHGHAHAHPSAATVPYYLAFHWTTHGRGQAYTVSTFLCPRMCLVRMIAHERGIAQLP